MQRRSRRHPLVVVSFGAAMVGCWLMAVPPAADAQDDRYPLFDRFNLTAGGRQNDLDTTIRIDSQNFGVGTELDVEDVLGIEDEQENFDLGFQWHLSRRHEVFAAWSTYQRDGQRQISRQVEVGGTTFPIGVTIATDFDIQTLTAGYSYYFYRAERAAFGVGGGLRQYRFDIALALQGTQIAQEADVSGPLPFVAFDYRYAFSPSWRFLATLGAFDVSVGDFEGSQLLADAAVEYLPLAHLAIGGGLDLGEFDVDADGENWRGSIDSRISAWRLFARVRW